MSRSLLMSAKADNFYKTNFKMMFDTGLLRR